MPWSSSDRVDRLPPDWKVRVRIVRDRAGGRCQAVERGRRCPYPGAECDHVVRGDDHSVSNLAWLCWTHHRDKTLAEATAARAQMYALGRPQATPHPGMLS